MYSKPPFRVLIIGGSVSGLTLANALDKAKIDFLVLEKRPEIVFGAGAALGLLPNGLRILDQLNVYSELLIAGTPIHTTINRWKNGQAFSKSHFTERIEKRHGYPFLFVERERLLRILYAKIPDKSKILTSKECISIRHVNSGVHVTCTDGSSFGADIIVGSDGVHSTSRRAMLEIMSKRNSCFRRNISNKEMFSDYFCILGESLYRSHDPELIEGMMNITCDKGRIFILICCKGNKKFWFLYLKYPTRYQYPDIPRLSLEEIHVTMMENFDIKVTEHLSPETLWNCRSKYTMVPFEEGLLDRWYANRIVCQGDAVYKMTPNAGLGANCAIESAACLANVLEKLMHQKHGSSPPAYSDIQMAFGEYEKSRYGRVKTAYETSYLFTRLQALDNKLYKFLYTQISPVLGEDFEINALTNIVIGGPPLTFYNYKGKKGLVPWEGWNLSASSNASQSPVLRTINWLLYHMAPAISGCWLTQHLVLASGSNQSRGMDSVLYPGQCIGAFGNLLAIGTVMAVETFRGSVGNTWSVLPWMVGFGLSISAWKAFTAVYLLVLSRKLFQCKSTRAPFSSVSPSYAAALISALIAVPSIHIITVTVAAHGIGWSTGFTSASGLVLIYPMIIPVLSWVLRLLGNFDERQEIIMGTAEIPTLQGAYLISAVLSLILHVYSTLRSRPLLDTSACQAFLVSLMRLILGAKYLDGETLQFYVVFTSFSMIMAYVNVVTLTRPAHKVLSAKMCLTVKMTLGSALIGPGATIALLWIWREDRVRKIDH